MDTEEGVEVVWNEVQFSDKKVFKSFEVQPCLFSNINIVGGILSMLHRETSVKCYCIVASSCWYGDRNNA